MGCILVLALFGLPRVALAWLWLTHHGYVAQAFGGQLLWTALGFLFLPTTTLAYAWADHAFQTNGVMSVVGWCVVAFGFFIDVGINGGGGAAARRRRRS